MKQLINAITAENRKRLEQFINDINLIESKEGLDTWHYRELLPRGKDVSKMTLDGLRAYLIGRKEKQINKIIEREVAGIKEVFAAGTLVSVKISIEWKRSRMWGNNPNAECWYTYKKDGNTQSGYVTSGSIGGCGYDKQSTAVANCLRQINEVLKPMYEAKNKYMASHEIKNHNDFHREFFGYGSGYGVLPSIEGGVGVSCYPKIFESIGYKFETVASGKSFDVYQINKSI